MVPVYHVPHPLPYHLCRSTTYHYFKSAYLSLWYYLCPLWRILKLIYPFYNQLPLYGLPQKILYLKLKGGLRADKNFTKIHFCWPDLDFHQFIPCQFLLYLFRLLIIFRS